MKSINNYLLEGYGPAGDILTYDGKGSIYCYMETSDYEDNDGANVYVTILNLARLKKENKFTSEDIEAIKKLTIGESKNDLSIPGIVITKLK